MEAWIAAYAEAEGLARSARSWLRVLEANGGEGGSEEAVKVRRLLGRLQQAGDELDNDLVSLEMDGRITEKEVARRREQLAQLSSERRVLTQQLSAAATAAASAPAVSVRASLPVLSSAEARQLNSVSVRAQESLLDDLGTSLRRQHSLGQAMGREVDEQQPLLEAIGQRTMRSDGKVRRETERIAQFEVGRCSVALWVVAALLAIVLIILLATDGGCKIVFSATYCRSRPWLSHGNFTT